MSAIRGSRTSSIGVRDCFDGGPPSTRLMSRAIAPEPVYRPPWDVSLARRLAMLRAAPRKVAYFHPKPDASTFRYRCYAMAHAVNRHLAGTAATWFTYDDGPLPYSLLQDLDLLVLVRTPWTPELAQMIHRAREAATPLLFDVDDLVFDPSRVVELVASLDAYEADDRRMEHIWNHWFAETSRIRLTMEMTDGVIVTNSFLGNEVQQSTAQPVWVVPNFMTEEQVAYSNEILRFLDNNPERPRDEFHLGYFSGSSTHRRDFGVAVPAICEVLEAHQRVHLRIVGHMEIPKELRDFKERVHMHPHTNFLNLQRLIAFTEVNLAPLQDTAFTNCKSELKYFDAAAVGVPTVASPTFAMSRAISHGQNGLLAEDNKWHECLRWLVDHYPALGSTIGKGAREDASKTHVGYAHLDSISIVLEEGCA